MFDRFESVYFEGQFSAPAADLGGQTGQGLGQDATFEGFDVFDVGEVLDRRDIGIPVWCRHQLWAYIGSTQTADGTVRADLEISLSATRKVAQPVGDNITDVADTSGDFGVDVNSEDFLATDDLVGPSLEAVGHGPITDGTNGVGGGGTPGKSEWEGNPMLPPILDAGDDVFFNGALEHSNVSDAAIHADIDAWWVIGVLEG